MGAGGSSEDLSKDQQALCPRPSLSPPPSLALGLGLKPQGGQLRFCTMQQEGTARGWLAGHPALSLSGKSRPLCNLFPHQPKGHLTSASLSELEMVCVDCGAHTRLLHLWEAGLLSETAAGKPPSSCRPPAADVPLLPLVPTASVIAPRCPPPAPRPHGVRHRPPMSPSCPWSPRRPSSPPQCPPPAPCPHGVHHRPPRSRCPPPASGPHGIHRLPASLS